MGPVCPALELPLIPAISRKIKGVSEIRIQILVPHPKMNLKPTFGAPAPPSFVYGGTGSTIIWQSYWSF
ncbi:hypothetical protein TNCV_4980991 [Trichonephila clavipes]|nr:hypothetical protein TNCV_4980991 [Trichonephila clavipes]